MIKIPRPLQWPRKSVFSKTIGNKDLQKEMSLLLNDYFVFKYSFRCLFNIYTRYLKKHNFGNNTNETVFCVDTRNKDFFWKTKFMDWRYLSLFFSIVSGLQ